MTKNPSAVLFLTHKNSHIAANETINTTKKELNTTTSLTNRRCVLNGTFDVISHRSTEAVRLADRVEGEIISASTITFHGVHAWKNKHKSVDDEKKTEEKTLKNIETQQTMHQKSNYIIPTSSKGHPHW